MTGQLVLRPVTTVWPIHRKQVLEEVLAEGRHGEIYQVWVTTGHVFISLDKGRKLLTFDVKPVGIGQDYQFGNLGCLDLGDITPPLRHLVYSQSLNSALLIQQNGCVEVWRFVLSDYHWERVCEDRLCAERAGVVTSACLLDELHTLYWCDRDSGDTDGQGTVWKRDFGTDGSVRFGPPVKLLDNSPHVELSPLTRGVFASCRDSGVISGLVFQPHTNSVTVYDNNNVYSYKPANSVQCLDFREIILPHLTVNSQQKTPSRDLFDCTKKCVVMVSAGGDVRRLSDKHGLKALKDFKGHADLTPYGDLQSKYFIHRDCIGQVTSDAVILFNYVTGGVTKHELTSPLLTAVQLNHLSPAPQFTTFINRDGINTLQLVTSGRSHAQSGHTPDITCYARELEQSTLGGRGVTETAELVCKSFLQGSAPSRAVQVDGKHFQNPALVITMLDQLQEKVNTPRMNKQRVSVLEGYQKTHTYQHTRYSETVGSYLTEYLRLEKIISDLFDQKKWSLIKNNDNVEKQTLSLIDPSSCLPATVRQAELEQLATDHPETVLVTLMQQLDIESQELTEPELEKWSAVLASENVVTAGFSGGTFSLYEIITRLLFLQKPDQLGNFVLIAQLIHDKNVGVSAFIRKRQTFQYYERALSCLPPPHSSKDVPGAVKAKAKILLAMQTRCSLVKAVQLLVEYEQWEVAVDVLTQNADNSPTHQELFFLLLTAIAQRGVLSKYCVPVLQQRPGNTSLISILEMIGPQDEGRRPIRSSRDVFYRGSADVEIGQVQTIFLSILNKQS